eukprot:m51a1_g3524 hypothetical protein (193) ;mRNA; f:927715-928293
MDTSKGASYYKALYEAEHHRASELEARLQEAEKSLVGARLALSNKTVRVCTVPDSISTEKSTSVADPVATQENVNEPLWVSEAREQRKKEDELRDMHTKLTRTMSLGSATSHQRSRTRSSPAAVTAAAAALAARSALPVLPVLPSIPELDPSGPVIRVVSEEDSLKREEARLKRAMEGHGWSHASGVTNGAH